MLDLLDFLTERPVIVSLACVGAALCILGSLGRPTGRTETAVFAVGLGYGLTGLSVVLFIVAGFLAID